MIVAAVVPRRAAAVALASMLVLAACVVAPAIAAAAEAADADADADADVGAEVDASDADAGVPVFSAAPDMPGIYQTTTAVPVTVYCTHIGYAALNVTCFEYALHEDACSDFVTAMIDACARQTERAREAMREAKAAAAAAARDEDDEEEEEEEEEEAVNPPVQRISMEVDVTNYVKAAVGVRSTVITNRLLIPLPIDNWDDDATIARVTACSLAAGIVSKRAEDMLTEMAEFAVDDNGEVKAGPAGADGVVTDAGLEDCPPEPSAMFRGAQARAVATVLSQQLCNALELGDSDCRRVRNFAVFRAHNGLANVAARRALRDVWYAATETLQDAADMYANTVDAHQALLAAFSSHVARDDLLRRHRAFVEANDMLADTTVDKSAGWLWQLIVDELDSEFSFVDVGMGSASSLVSAVAAEEGKKAKVIGVATNRTDLQLRELADESVEALNKEFDVQDWTQVDGTTMASDVVDAVAEATNSAADVIFLHSSINVVDMMLDLDVYAPLVRPGGFLVVGASSNNLNQGDVFRGYRTVSSAVDQTLPPFAIGERARTDFEFLFAAGHTRVWRRKDDAAVAGAGEEEDE